MLLIFSVVQSEVSTLKEQMVDRFVPDDMCPQGAFLDTQQKLYDSNHRTSVEEVLILNFDELPE